MTEEVSGTHARISLHTEKPVFYIYLPSDPKRDSSSDIFASWALSRATIKKDHRVFAQVRFTQLTGNAKRNDSEVDVSTEMLPDGWVRITPKAPLTPGEYALQPISKTQNVFSTVVFDFSIDPKAPNSMEAVSAHGS